MYENHCDALIHLVEGWKDYECYANKLRKLRPQLIERLNECFKSSPSDFNCLIHGDVWTNNIMISYDKTTNQLENVALIDLQTCRWTSPAIDLQFYFNVCLEEHLRLHHQEELVQFYHNELTEMLKKLNYKKSIPTLPEFRVQFVQKELIGSFYCSVYFISIYSRNIFFSFYF